MISKTIGFRGTNHFQTHTPDADDAASTPDADGWRQSLWHCGDGGDTCIQ